ncbi:MAG: glycogen/starch/alpha-glucan family phosphorylase, partial [Cyanobacteria bacterium]|nr:glycogen/starch/alpha-glucan family phosphorylase [Cyanobacteriota bacterium]
SQGRQLRLEQQYFFVSCSLQTILRLHKRAGRTPADLHEKFIIQLNDTHPSIAVAELMRLLVDEHDVEWGTAWDVTTKCFAYTNHTLLPEALERWPVSLFQDVLPRHLEIIYEINRRFLEQVQHDHPGDAALVKRVSIIEEDGERSIRMAHLACVGSSKINGVAALHTELLKERVLTDFHNLYPNKFVNITNGVTPRRWVKLSNPELSDLITRSIGDEWIKDLPLLKGLEKFQDDRGFQDEWMTIKHKQKERLSKYLLDKVGVALDANSIFDIQVKRIHEYKRQHLNVLHIISLYNYLKNHEVSPDFQPRTFIFGGKAAPGYFIAKLIIKLITSVGDIVNNDPDVRDLLKVVFVPDFNVSTAQRIYPAADVSEQISTAGKEASGTGNMKFGLNGAVTIGTMDGANIEIREEAGAENFFLFGLTAEEVMDWKSQGYYPRGIYEQDMQLKQVLDQLSSGKFSPGNPHLFQPLVDSLLGRDDFMLLADYRSYIDCQMDLGEAYRDRKRWAKMSILNVARLGKFSSDRAVMEYCEKIWNVKPVRHELKEYIQASAELTVKS